MQIVKESINPLQEKILDVLQKQGNQNRSGLVKLIGSFRTTIYDNLVPLVKKGIVIKYSRHENVLGRPTVYYRINWRVYDKLLRE